jgi:hypothetical protein
MRRPRPQSGSGRTLCTILFHPPPLFICNVQCRRGGAERDGEGTAQLSGKLAFIDNVRATD